VVAAIIEIYVSRLSDYARAKLVQGVVDRYGLAKASKLLGVSRSYVYQISRRIGGLPNTSSQRL
jgi:transposase-like protein